MLRARTDLSVLKRSGGPPRIHILLGLGHAWTQFCSTLLLRVCSCLLVACLTICCVQCMSSCIAMDFIDFTVTTVHCNTTIALKIIKDRGKRRQTSAMRFRTKIQSPRSSRRRALWRNCSIVLWIDAGCQFLCQFEVLCKASRWGY